MTHDWSPTLPSMGVAQEAYQLLYELSKRHPDDTDLANELECARHLRDHVWREHDRKRRAAL